MKRHSKAAGAIEAVGGWPPADEAEIGNAYQAAWWETKQEMLAARDRLLFFAETGRKSYPSR